MFKQIENLIKTAGTLNQKQLTCFALACCERQFSVYEKASIGQQWAESEVLRKYLTLAWDWLETGSQLPDDASEVCGNCVPADPVDVQFHAATDVAFSVATAILYATSGDIKHVIAIAEKSHDLVNELVYSITDLEINSDNNRIIDAHFLMQSEVERQERDLKFLQVTEFNIDAALVIRLRSVGVSLFGGEWYPEDY